MQLSERLLGTIEELVNAIDRHSLYASATALSLRYREKGSKEQVFIKSPEEALAYLCTRFPATFAANCCVFSEVKEPICSILDVGSGSGSAFWAAKETLSGLISYAFLERDAFLIEIGKKLLESDEKSISTSWIEGDFTKIFPEGLFDLIVFSYSLGEVKENEWKLLLQKAWNHSNEWVVIVEPGTPLGYRRLMKMRDILITLGGHVMAPCPHSQKCPLLQGEDWCHFSQRLPRSPLHRLVKEGSLGFEDEKFSYVIISKSLPSPKGERVLRPPLKRGGYIEWKACTPFEGVIDRKTFKKNKELFQKAKKLTGGSFYDEDLSS
ncbi:MAG: hypothetical protein FJZ63_03715 [Chlamydiae bacterium]|nr:hypothetical protein [Chlamydiota bacterium]